MGRCARLAWDHAVADFHRAPGHRPGVTTAHLLLGVLIEDRCAGGLILSRLGLDLSLAQGMTEFVIMHSRQDANAEERVVEWDGETHTIQALRVLELSLEEANLYSATYPIGTEHVLLGLLRVSDGSGCRVLNWLGIDEGEVRRTRDELWQLLRSTE
jgi:ATP-dependent Clp protease ATP-binding subunit ClpC